MKHLKVTSHLQRPKNCFSFYLTKFKSVVLSSIYKKCIKKSQKGLSYLGKTHFQIKLINQEGS